MKATCSAHKRTCSAFATSDISVILHVLFRQGAGAQLRVSATVLVDGSAGADGGGLIAGPGAAAAFTGGSLRNNTARGRGGGASLATPLAFLWGVAVQGNTALRSGGGLSLDADFAAACAAAAAAAQLLLPPGSLAAAAVAAGAAGGANASQAPRLPAGVGPGCPSNGTAPFSALAFSMCDSSRRPTHASRPSFVFTPCTVFKTRIGC